MVLDRFMGKPSAKKPTLGETVSELDANIARYDTKIEEARVEISALLAQRNKMRPGAGHNALTKKAKDIVTRKRRLEASRDNLMAQVGNLDNARDMEINLKSSMATVDALKTANKELKKQYGKVDLDKIERMQDEMADLMDMGNEIQETMARSYNVPEDFDENEIDAELEILGAEMEAEAQFASESAGGVPDFLRDEVPQFIDEAPESGGKVQEVAR